MKIIIGKFFAKIRERLFTARVEREIYRKIFPHLRQEADNGYPFSSADELTREQIRGFLVASKLIRDLEQAGDKMPAAYGEAFRYVAYRDLNDRLTAYIELARESEYNPAPGDYQFAASRA